MIKTRSTASLEPPMVRASAIVLKIGVPNRFALPRARSPSGNWSTYSETTSTSGRANRLPTSNRAASDRQKFCKCETALSSVPMIAIFFRGADAPSEPAATRPRRPQQGTNATMTEVLTTRKQVLHHSFQVSVSVPETPCKGKIAPGLLVRAAWILFVRRDRPWTVLGCAQVEG